MTEENSAASTGTGRKERRKEWWQKYKKEMKGQKADQEDESIEGKDKKLKSPSVKRKRQSEDKSTQGLEKRKKTAVSEQSESDEESSDTGKDSQKDTQKPKKKDKKYVLFLGNLTYTTKEEDIRKHFADLVGRLAAVRLMTHKDTGRSRGFAYIELPSKKSHRLALRLHQTELKGRKINVEFTSAGKKSDKRKQKLEKKNKRLEKFKMPLREFMDK